MRLISKKKGFTTQCLTLEHPGSVLMSRSSSQTLEIWSGQGDNFSQMRRQTPIFTSAVPCSGSEGLLWLM